MKNMKVNMENGVSVSFHRKNNFIIYSSSSPETSCFHSRVKSDLHGLNRRN